MEKLFHIGSVVFNSWTITRQIGKGSFGTVYEIQREDFGQVYHAALKVITVPQSEEEVRAALEEACLRHRRSNIFTAL